VIRCEISEQNPNGYCNVDFVIRLGSNDSLVYLTLILLTWRIWWAPNNVSKWQMGFNSAFKVLRHHGTFRYRAFTFVIKMCTVRPYVS